MVPTLWRVTVLASAALVVLGAARIDAAEPFYQGKTIRIIVGFSPGGGFDAYSRAIGRQMGKHIPGNPSVIVENMTGAASLVAANHTFKVAKPDGLTIVNFHGKTAVLAPLPKPAASLTMSSSKLRKRRSSWGA